MKNPEILMPDGMRKVNDYLLAQTGCFAFLIADRQWRCSEPKGGKEAFELWSVALYTVYHDYGCEYLRYVLDPSNAPVPGMADDLKKCRTHVDDVTRTFRTLIAHGVLDLCSYQKVQKTIVEHYMKPADRKNIHDIPDISEEQWFEIAKRLKADSDFLKDTLYCWADNFGRSRIPTTVSERRRKFGNSRNFINSVSERVVFDSLDRDQRGAGGDCARDILDGAARNDGNRKDAAATLKEWREAVRKDFLCEKLKTPDDILRELKNFLYEIHNPSTTSSVALAAKYGFSLEGL